MKFWDEVFNKPVDLRLYVMHTGTVHMAGNIHFNRKSPKFEEKPTDSRFNPVLSFLVSHPQKGHVLLDTGIHPDFCTDRYGNFGRLIGRLIHIRTEPGRDAVSQLGTLGLSAGDIGSIVLSHLHPDHTSGLPLFRENGRCRVYADGDELEAAQAPLALFKGYLKGHLKYAQTEALVYDGRRTPFDAVFDFFGDESLFIVKTAGHTAGHVSALLNMRQGPVLLTFDAAHRAENLTDQIPTKGRYTDGLKSVRQLAEFTACHSRCRIIYAHDPDQIGNLKLLPEYYE